MPLFIRLTKTAINTITTKTKTAIIMMPLLQSTKGILINFISQKTYYFIKTIKFYNSKFKVYPLFLPCMNLNQKGHIADKILLGSSIQKRRQPPIKHKKASPEPARSIPILL